MKFTKSLLFTISLLLTNLSFSAPTAGAYITDEQDFFVSGNKVNEALERVNLLLCYLANTKPADFVNKETYIATIFEEDCAFGKASGDDQSKASQGKSGSQGKKNKKADSIFWGMGYYTRANNEICLLATKGKPKRFSRSVHQVVIEKIREHSRKPDRIRNDIVELCGDLPRIELFARQKADGWDSWGNEL